MFRRARSCALLISLLTGCAAKDAPRAAAPAAPAISPAFEPPTEAPAAPPSSAPQASPAAAPVPLRLVRELEAPVTHVALDAAPHAAALSPGRVFVHDRKGWREEALPPKLREAPDAALNVFFGRDFRVRVVGVVASPHGIESVYLRWLPGGLRPAPDEIGQLGNTRRGALVSVLGTADPELVCRPSDVCIVKRLSGWTRLPAPADLTHVAITEGNGFALAGQRLLKAEREWRPVEPAGSWQAAGALFTIGDRAFVLEPAKKLVHELRGGEWHVFDSPVGTPRAIWGAAPDALWLVGEAGIRHFDGQSWREVENSPKDLRAVLGRSAADVWFGGASGLYRLE